MNPIVLPAILSYSALRHIRNKGVVMLKKLIAVFLIISVFAFSGVSQAKDILVELLDEHGEAVITVNESR